MVKEKEKEESKPRPSESKQVQRGQLVSSHVADKQLPSRRERASEKKRMRTFNQGKLRLCPVPKEKDIKKWKSKCCVFLGNSGNLSCLQFYKLEAQQVTAPREEFLGRISTLSH